MEKNDYEHDFKIYKLFIKGFIFIFSMSEF